VLRVRRGGGLCGGLLLRRAAGGLLLLDLRARHAVRRQQRDELLLGEGEAQREEGNYRREREGDVRLRSPPRAAPLLTGSAGSLASRARGPASACRWLQPAGRIWRAQRRSLRGRRRPGVDARAQALTRER